MTRCRGTTRSGERCRREVSGDSDYCYMHRGQAESDEDGARWEESMDDTVKVALGLGLLAAILLLPIPFLRRRC